MNRALKYEDLKELGDGAKVYCVNHNNSSTGILIVRSEIDDMNQEGFMLEPYSDIGDEFTGHLISFMENAFYRTAEDAVHSVFENIERLISEEMEKLVGLRLEFDRTVQKVSTLWDTYLQIKEMANSTIE